MIIAVTHENGNVFEHYGKTTEFKLYKLDSNKNIISSEILKCGEYKHEMLSVLLKKNNVDVLIVGGIGAHAIDSLKENGINEIYNGVLGSCDDAISMYQKSLLSFNKNKVNCNCHH